MSTRFTFGDKVNLQVSEKQLETTYSGFFKRRNGETWLMFEGPGGEMYSRRENSFPSVKGAAPRLSKSEKTQQG